MPRHAPSMKAPELFVRRGTMLAMSDAPVTPQSLHAAARAAQRTGNARALESIARELIAHAQNAGDDEHLALGHYYLGSAHFWRNDGRAAQASYETALALYTQAKDKAGIARVRIGMAAVAVDIDLHVDKGHALYEQALPIVRELDDKTFLAVTLGNLAEVCRLEGAYDPAMRYAAESAALYAQLGRLAQAGGQLATIAHIHALRRDYSDAIARMREAWEYFAGESSPRYLAWYFDIWFLIAAGMRRWETAARLLGFLNRYRDENNARRLQGILPWFSSPVERLSEQLGAQRAQELILEGQQLTVESAQDLVEKVR